MTVSLWALSDGRVSLEFAAADGAMVGSVIAALYGAAEHEWFGIVRVDIFGGCRFVYQAEWDDPCLIATCNAGSDILRAVAARCRQRPEDIRSSSTPLPRI